MNKAIERLKKILKLEQQQGYRNKAVIGGLGRLAERWQIDALQEATLDGQPALVDQIVTRLDGYGNLQGSAARKEGIEAMLALAGQWESPPAPQFTAPKPAPPPASRPIPEAPKAVPQPVRAESPTKAAPPPAPLPAKPAAPPLAPRPPAAPKPAPLPPSPGPAYANVRPTPVGTASLQASISRLPGIGPNFSERLGKMGIHTIGDMLWLLPRRYDDYRAMKSIYQLRDGDEVTILANLWDLKSKRLPGRGAAFTTGLLGDSTATIQVSWFNPYVVKQLKTGQS